MDQHLEVDKTAFTNFLSQFNTPENAETYNHLAKRFDPGFQSPAFHIIRHEIRTCIVCELHQAAITLTNHYLEKFLKVSLVNSICPKMIHDKGFDEERRAAIKRFGSKPMSTNIATALEKQIITNNESKVLDTFKDTFRDTFSHFDHQKLIPNHNMNLQMFDFTKIEPPKSIDNVSAKSFTFAAGFFDYDFAKEHSWVYFLCVDDIAMRYEMKQMPDLVKLINEQGYDLEKVFNEVDFGSPVEP